MERPRPPPELIDDAITEIVLRLPPDDPTCLVRTSLVCKPWRQLLSDPALLRRYREFHRAPPLLGFLRNHYHDGPHVRFVPTAAAASPFSTRALNFDYRWTVDCRHGRALLNSYCYASSGLIVWDPITGDQRRVPASAYPYGYYTAPVLCGTDGCDHLGCHDGPFRVVFVGTDVDEGVKRVSVYSSETRDWSSAISIQLNSYVEERPSLLAGEALYFSLDKGKRILKDDLVGRALSLIDAPAVYKQLEGIVVTAEDGGLGFTGVKDDCLYLWSWQAGPDGIAGWAQGRVIKLKTLLPDLDPSVSLGVVGFAEGTDTIFMSADVGVFAIMLRSRQVRKVGERDSYDAIAPYMSFFTSDLAKAPCKKERTRRRCQGPRDMKMQ